MTTLYFVRHSEVEYRNDVEDSKRQLSNKGQLDVANLIKYFESKQIDEVISSPYKRAIQTVEGVSKRIGRTIKLYDELRERKIADGHIEDFHSFVLSQWDDFNFKLENGESLNETKERAVYRINKIVEEYNGKCVVIGTHGTILVTILNHLNKDFGYEEWKTMKMPEIYEVEFENEVCKSIQKIEYID